MENSPEKIGPLEKLTRFLGGFLLSFFIFMVFIKIVPNLWGALLGLIFNGTAGWYILKKYPPKTSRRIIGYGVITSIIAVIALSLILWTVLLTLFQGISN